jgi:large conductance mechanosensitive channel
MPQPEAIDVHETTMAGSIARQFRATKPTAQRASHTRTGRNAADITSYLGSIRQADRLALIAVCTGLFLTAGKAMLNDFKQFAMRGNVVDLAVGVIIGAAFGNIVTSLVNDVIMPPLGLILGQVDFSSLFLSLTGADFPSLKAAQDAGAPVIAYGKFINTIINFLIVAFAMFIVISNMNRLLVKKKAEEPPPAPPAPPKSEVLLEEIRDLLAKR